MIKYIIQGDETCPNSDEYLFWSNEDGWVSKGTATHFAKEEIENMSMPMGFTHIEKISVINAVKGPPRLPQTLDFSNIIENITETMEQELSGEEIAEVYNIVRSRKIKYVEDSMWEYVD